MAGVTGTAYANAAATRVLPIAPTVPPGYPPPWMVTGRQLRSGLRGNAKDRPKQGVRIAADPATVERRGLSTA